MTSLPELETVRAASPAMPAHTLPIGTRLREYEIKGLIGEGTCSIVYLAWDHALQRKVAVKEYMPAAMVGRIQGSTNVVVAADRHLEAVRAGLRGFVNEARLLARFDHPSLIKVYRFWEENGTAYMVMPYYEGPTLKAALAELGHVPSETELRTWLKPILNAVTLLHDGGVWHQNIGPDEILLTPFGPVLLGFAAAAHAIEAMNHTPAAALKAGFAAIEQYGSEAATTRGPWTDLYAAGRGDLRRDHRQRARTGRRPARQRPPAPARRRRRRSLQRALPDRDRRCHGGAAEAAPGRSHRIPRPDGRHRRARGRLARAAARPDAGAVRWRHRQRARGHRARPTAARRRRADGGDGRSRRDRDASIRACAGPGPAQGAGTVARRREQPDDALLDEDRRRTRLARQARALRCRRRHVRVDRHRRARASVRHARRRLGGAGRHLVDSEPPCPGTRWSGNADDRSESADDREADPTGCSRDPADRHPDAADGHHDLADRRRDPVDHHHNAPEHECDGSDREAVFRAGDRQDAADGDRSRARRPWLPTCARPGDGANGRTATAAATARPSPRAAAATRPLVATSPDERQARCTEILQKASLEKITPAETDYFKRHCK